MATVMLPAGLAERVETLIGRSARRATAATGGFSNLVFFVDDDLVVKAASTPLKRRDLVREAAILGSVADLGLVAPRLVAAHNDDDWAILVTNVCVGQAASTDWGRFTHELSADNERAWRLGKAIGHRLRSIHDAAPFPIAGSLAQRTDLLKETLVALDTRIADGEALAETLREQMVAALADPIHDRSGVFIHGDFGLHNCLLDDPLGGATVSGVLDWELSGWGHALTDLAWLAWTLWFRQLPPAVWEGCVQSYGDWAVTALGWSDASVRCLVLAQMSILLARTEPETSVRGVWTDRIASLGRFSVPPVGEA